ncbi:MAG: DUF4440 domain-containing protein [Novosphingobium sp.]|nr:DUF4440 domain-containing protein [Novosphingobium sp.]
MDVVAQVEQHEHRLLAAMLDADVTTLAELIDDRLVFTGPDGNPVSKEQDLTGYRSGKFKLTRLDPKDQTFQQLGELVVSTSKAELAGKFGDMAFAGTYAYTRVWAEQEGSWRVVAGHASAIA